jgi:hypothetical protein
MSDYTFDAEAAKQADSGNGRINETGKYIGVFTVAKKVTSQKGTNGIEFSFKSENGKNADYLTMWTVNAAGEQIYGYKQLMSLMRCIRAKELTAQKAEIEEYDKTANGMVTRTADVYQALMNKPIGVLLQMEEYAKKDGSIGEKPSFAGFFDAKTGQVAIELIENSDAKILEKMEAQLVPIKKLKGARPTSQSYGNTSAAMPDDWDVNF